MSFETRSCAEAAGLSFFPQPDKGHHHYIDLGLVAEVEGQKVRLSANAAVAVTMEEEASSKADELE